MREAMCAAMSIKSSSLRLATTGFCGRGTLGIAGMGVALVWSIVKHRAERVS
jgi:hypothetical protein